MNRKKKKAKKETEKASGKTLAENRGRANRGRANRIKARALAPVVNRQAVNRLARPAGPAVLGEVGFFSNIHDARYLDSCAGQEAIGRAYLTGVLPYVRG